MSVRCITFGLPATYANRDIFGCREEPVDQCSHERRVQAELDRKLSQFRICHALGYNDCANCDSWMMSEANLDCFRNI